MATRPGDALARAGSTPDMLPWDSHRPGGGAWIEAPFQATVQGAGAGGERYRLNTVLDGLSSSFLTLRLPCPVVVDQALFIVVSLAEPARAPIAGPRVAVRGVVVQAEERPGGVWAVTAAIRRHRFLYARAS